MGYSISDAVSDILDEMQFLHVAFRQDVVNYSALARLIKPLVEEKVGAGAGLDAIIMGIRRYADAMPKGETTPDLVGVVKDCTMSLRTDMGSVSVKYWRTPEFMQGLYDLERNVVDWHAGEKVYITRRSYEMTLIFTSKFFPAILKILESAKSTQLMEKREGLAVISVAFPPAAFNVPGVFSFFANQFAQANIKVLTMFSTYRMVSFLIEGKDAPKAYERISNSISSCRALHARLASETLTSEAVAKVEEFPRV